MGVHKWETVSLENVAYILNSDEFPPHPAMQVLHSAKWRNAVRQHPCVVLRTQLLGARKTDSSGSDPRAHGDVILREMRRREMHGTG